MYSAPVSSSLTSCGALPATLTAMIGVPTSTVSPSLTSSSETSPSNGQGSSTTLLAVSISQIVWLTETLSPGATFQETISASVRPSPTSGSGNLAIVMDLP